MEFGFYKEEESVSKSSKVSAIFNEKTEDAEFDGLRPIIESVKEIFEVPEDQKPELIGQMISIFGKLHKILKTIEVPKLNFIIDLHLFHFMHEGLSMSPEEAYKLRSNILLVATDLTNGDNSYSQELINNCFIDDLRRIFEMDRRDSVVVPAVACLNNVIISLDSTDFIDMEDSIKIAKRVTSLCDPKNCKYFSKFIAIYFKDKSMTRFESEEIMSCISFLVNLRDYKVNDHIGELFTGMIRQNTFIFSPYSLSIVRKWLSVAIDENPFVALKFISMILEKYSIEVFKALEVDVNNVLSKIDYEDEELSCAAFCALAYIVRMDDSCLSNPGILGLISTTSEWVKNMQFNVKDIFIFMATGIINNIPDSSYNEEMLYHFLDLLSMRVNNSLSDEDLSELVCSILNIDDYSKGLPAKPSYTKLFDEVVSEICEFIFDYDTTSEIEEFKNRFVNDED